jgi:hypothetical protein
VVEVILKAAAVVNAVDTDVCTVRYCNLMDEQQHLMLPSITAYSISSFERLYENGIIIHRVTAACIPAGERGHLYSAQLLLSHGAEVFLNNNVGCHPLFWL